MVDLLVRIDGEPLSRWGADGLVLSTPTGSTAYAWSAGGPVVWPDVEALLVVPLSAHALFARPLVVSPTCEVSAEMLSDRPQRAVVWCDGRRQLELAEGDTVVVRRSDRPVPLARLHSPAFVERLVGKFDLPVEGWRRPRTACGLAGAPSMIEEIAIRGLGVIESAEIRPGSGFTALTGETGAGKTMILTAVALLMGSKAPTGLVRGEKARVEGG